MKDHKGKIVDIVKEYKIVDCTNCGYLHIYPIPAFKELKGIYSSKYYTQEKPVYLKGVNEDKAWWDTVYNDRLETVERIINKKTGRILELGPGPGLFLEYAKQKGWDVFGVDASDDAVRLLKKKGLPVFRSFFEAIEPSSLGKFDAVFLFEVLEHVSDPLYLLKLINSLLKKGGAVCLSVPNDYNPLQKIVVDALGEQKYWLAPPFHINYFSIYSIKKILKKSGFSVSYVETNFPMELFLLMGDNYVGDKKFGRLMHGKRKKLDIALSEYNNLLKRSLYGACANLGIGRNITIYGQKI